MQNQPVYNTLGNNYNLTRQADTYISERVLQLLDPKSGEIYLDIGCGTGNYTNVFAEGDISFIGLDQSDRMLAEAYKRNRKARWVLGSAEKMPLEGGSVHGAVAMLTIHHWKNLPKAFSEIKRVLKNKGKLVIFTSTAEQMEHYWLKHYFPKMLEASIRQMLSLTKIEKVLSHAGFKTTKKELYHIRNEQKDLFLYAGKNKPELYFDAAVRNGISSFSGLSNIIEVEEGLKKLMHDLNNNTFSQVRSAFKDDLGDYLFIVAESI